MLTHVTHTRNPAVAECTSCGASLLGRRSLLVQGYTGGRWLAEFLCDNCAHARRAESMDKSEAVALFDRLAARDFNIHDYNRWGVGYLEERARFREEHGYDADRLAASDLLVVRTLGEDPDVLFRFSTSTHGHYYARATLFGEGYGALNPELIGQYGPDAPATFLALFQEGDAQ